MVHKKCIHGKQKYYCKDCGGKGICQHDKRKERCKICGGNALCEHDKEKSRCRLCNGNSFCKHNRRKYDCKECGGSSICEHNKIKSQCKDCQGSSFCIHEKQKSRCKECGGSDLCKSEWCDTRKNDKYDGYCMPCYVNNPENHDKPLMRNYKTKEREVATKLLETFPDFTWTTDKKIQDGCSLRRPDLLLDLGEQVIIIEIDENKHSNYDCSCENKRLMQLSKDVYHRPIVFIRFNPDAYKHQDGRTIKSCWKLNKLGVMQVSKKKEWNTRINTLIEQVKYWTDNTTNKTIELFY